MRIKGIFLYKTKLRLIIIFGILIAIILMIISFYLVFNSGKNENININNDIFSAKSYYAKYRLNVYSNKNQNEYKIEEWYEKNDEGYRFKFVTNNEKNINFIYEGNQNSINIYSDSQINKISIEDLSNLKENLISISTFIEIISNVNKKIEDSGYEKNKCCNLLEEHEDGKVSYKITFNDVSENKCEICTKYTNGMNINQIELVMDEVTLMPIEYIVYNKDGKALYDIIYENFAINEKF